MTGIEEEDLERQLDIVRRHVANPLVGLFGPDTVTWRVEREAALFLGAGRALLLQLAHPWISAAIADHSHTASDPLGRFHRTFRIMFSIVFGTLDQAMGAARRLHRVHAQIVGLLREAAGPFPKGSPYFANELSALRWVSATLTETAVLAHELVLPPLSEVDRERYYAESKISATLMGIPQEALPTDWASFTAYNERMWDCATLDVTPAARITAQQVLGIGGTRWLHPPSWYRNLTAQLLPPRLREAFELPYGPAERAATERALRWVRRTYGLLPRRLRFVGPYFEAQGRLRGNTRPDLLTQASNKVWIGMRRLP